MIKKFYEIVFTCSAYYYKRNWLLKILLIPLYMIFTLIMSIIGWIYCIYGRIRLGKDEFNNIMNDNITNFVSYTTSQK